MSDLKEYKADERMKLFFNQLLDLKKFIKEMTEEKPDDVTLRHIYENLDKIFKERQE